MSEEKLYQIKELPDLKVNCHGKNHHPPFEPGLRPHLLWRGRYQPLEIRENAPIQKEDADDISGSLRVA